MDFSIKNLSQTSFGCIVPSKIVSGKNGKMFVESGAGKVIEIMNSKPEYLIYSGKKVIQYPVVIDGVPQYYNVKYWNSQHHSKGVGIEILNSNENNYQAISAREIAKDLDRKADIADKKANGINVFYQA